MDVSRKGDDNANNDDGNARNEYERENLKLTSSLIPQPKEMNKER